MKIKLRKKKDIFRSKLDVNAVEDSFMTVEDKNAMKFVFVIETIN